MVAAARVPGVSPGPLAGAAVQAGKGLLGRHRGVCALEVQQGESRRDGFFFAGGKPELGLGFSASSYP